MQNDRLFCDSPGKFEIGCILHVRPHLLCVGLFPCLCIQVLALPMRDKVAAEPGAATAAAVRAVSPRADEAEGHVLPGGVGECDGECMDVSPEAVARHLKPHDAVVVRALLQAVAVAEPRVEPP